MAKKITMDFVRWGAMSPQKHEEAKQSEKCRTSTFHMAPTVWGIYAFPHGFVYDFLLGSTDESLRQTNRFRWVKDAKGQRVKYEDFHDENFEKMKQNEKRLSRLNHMTGNCSWRCEGNEGYTWEGPANKFKYGGDVWHHLEFFHYEYNDAKYGCRPDLENLPFVEKDEYPAVLKKIRIVPMQAIIERSGSWVKTSIRDYRKALRKFEDCRKHFEALAQETQRKTMCYITSPEGCLNIKAQMEVFIEKV